MSERLFNAVLASCMLFGFGCASAPKPKPSTFEPPVMPTTCSYDIVRVYDSQVVSMQELVDQAAKARFVLIGEYHEQPDGQCFESAFFRQLIGQAPNALAALEFFERDEQAHIDDFIGGLTDEAAFIKSSARSAGNYSPAHRDIILASKEIGRPVIAANAPRRYVRLARTRGFEPLEKLGSEQSRLFAIPNVRASEAYRERFLDLMAPKDESGQRKGLDNAESMFRSQTMWDATMADSLLRAHRSSLGAPIVLIVGAFHVDDEGATAQYVREGAPEAARVTIVMKYNNEAIEPGCADFVVRLAAPKPE
ncbi:MAG: ChaN family lipoprotein [Phycisphaerales bacterium]